MKNEVQKVVEETVSTSMPTKTKIIVAVASVATAGLALGGYFLYKGIKARKASAPKENADEAKSE